MTSTTTAPLKPTRLFAKPGSKVSPEANSCDESKLAREILAGNPEALDWFQNHARPRVSAHLCAAAWNEETRFLALDVVDDLFSECFGGFAASRPESVRPRLLESYEGRSSIVTWLTRCALNRLKSQVRSKAFSTRAFPVASPNAERILEGLVAPDNSSVAVDTDHPLREVMREALKTMARDMPDDLILIQLHFIHGVERNRLARAWGIHGSTIGRRIEKTLLHLRHCLEAETRKLAARGGKKAILPYNSQDFLEVGCEGFFNLTHEFCEIN